MCNAVDIKTYNKLNNSRIETNKFLFSEMNCWQTPRQKNVARPDLNTSSGRHTHSHSDLNLERRDSWRLTVTSSWLCAPPCPWTSLLQPWV